MSFTIFFIIIFSKFISVFENLKSRVAFFFILYLNILRHAGRALPQKLVIAQADVDKCFETFKFWVKIVFAVLKFNAELTHCFFFILKRILAYMIL